MGRRVLTKAMKTLIKEHYLSGKSIRQVAKIVGLSYSAVHQFLADRGLVRSRQKGQQLRRQQKLTAAVTERR